MAYWLRDGRDEDQVSEDRRQTTEDRIADLGLWNTIYRLPFTVYDLNDFNVFNDLNGMCIC